ncbi:hypothetical protein WDV93_17755 [Pantoea ananatis]
MYDLNGRLLSETDTLNHTTTYHYPDEEETLPDRITDARGGDVMLEWNRQGLVTKRTDCSGSVTRFTYDRFGQLLNSEDAEGNITRREWNDAGLLTAVIRADGSQETLRWNEHGQLTAWRDPLESDVLWTYNRWGNRSVRPAATASCAAGTMTREAICCVWKTATVASTVLHMTRQATH